jgi:hypothetical protein
MERKYAGYPKLIRSVVESLALYCGADQNVLRRFTLDDRMGPWLAPLNPSSQLWISDYSPYFADLIGPDFNFQRQSVLDSDFRLRVPALRDDEMHVTFREFLAAIAAGSEIVLPSNGQQDSLLREEVRSMGQIAPPQWRVYSRVDESLKSSILIPSDVHLYLLVIFIFSFPAYRGNVVPGALNLTDPVRRYFPLLPGDTGEDLVTDFLQFLRIRSEQWSYGDKGRPDYSGGIVHLVGGQVNGKSISYPVPSTLGDLLDGVNQRLGMMTGSKTRLNRLAQEFQRSFLPRPRTEFQDLLTEIRKSFPKDSAFGSYTGVTWDMQCEEVNGRLRLEWGHRWQRNAIQQEKINSQHESLLASGKKHQCNGWSVGAHIPLKSWEQMIGQTLRCAMGPRGTASVDANGDHFVASDWTGFWVRTGSGIVSRTDFFLCTEGAEQHDSPGESYFICSQDGKDHVRLSEKQYKDLNQQLWKLMSRTLDLNRD